MASADAAEAAGIAIHALEPALIAKNNALPCPQLAHRQVRFIFQQAAQTECPQVLFPRINAYLEALQNQEQPLPPGLQTEGILFGPHSAAWCHRGLHLKQRLLSIREILRLRKLSQRANLRRLFQLNDPATAHLLQRYLGETTEVLPLADPVAQPHPDTKEIKPAPSTDTITFLLPGALRQGKGVIETLEAFRTWCPSSNKPIRLVLAGAIDPSFEPRLRAAQCDYGKSQPRTELITHFGQLSAPAFENHLSSAYFILLPYTRPLGSSGILGHAARLGKPVLATQNGLIGSLVRQYQLGTTFDIGSRHAWHRTLDRALQLPPQTVNSQNASYLSENSVASFQQTLLQCPSS